jgi:hypothetical protein
MSVLLSPLLLLALCAWSALAAKLTWTKGNWTNGLIMGRAYVLEWTSSDIPATTAVTIRCYKSTLLI